MAKKDVDTILKDQEDKILKKEDGEPATMKFYMIGGLLNMFDPNIDNPSLEDKIKRHELFEKVKKGGIVDLKPEEWAIIKKLVGLTFGPLVVGQVAKFIDK